MLEKRYIVSMNGYGVFATCSIPKGTIVMQMEDCVCVKSENVCGSAVEDLVNTVHIFDEDDMIIYDEQRGTAYFDDKLTTESMWYYLNHADTQKRMGYKFANVTVRRVRVSEKKAKSLASAVHFVTIADVKAGEELCFNYGTSNRDWTVRSTQEATISEA